MTVIECVVADSSKAIKLSCYNKGLFPMIQTENALIIMNSTCKPHEIVLTSDARALLIPNVDVGQDILSSAKEIIMQLTNPTAAEEKSILQILDLPVGTLVSCTVKVVQAEEVQTVVTKFGAETEVRNGIIADHSAAMAFAFWRNLAHLQFNTDGCIKISGGVLCKTTDGNPKISGNQRTVVEILPRDAVPVAVGTQRHEEEGNVVAVSNVKVYSSCKRNACYNKKLHDNKCPKCNTKYNEGEEDHSVICSIGIEQDDELSMVTLFTQQVKTLINKKDNFSNANSSNIEQEILHKLPLKIGFTRSPVKDTNTLSALKRL